MATALQVYGFPVSPYVRCVRAALVEKGVAYQLEEISLETLATPAYTQIHPFRKMPTIVDNGFMLYETAAILRYIDEAFEGPALQPATASSRAAMTRWISIAQSYLYSVGVVQIFIQRVLVPQMGGKTDTDLVAAATATTREHLGVLEKELTSTYLAGEALSLADLTVGSMLELVAFTREGEALLADFPRSRHWLDSLRGRESFKTTFPTALK